MTIWILKMLLAEIIFEDAFSATSSLKTYKGARPLIKMKPKNRMMRRGPQRLSVSRVSLESKSPEIGMM